MKVLFVEWCAKEALDGTANMDAMTELAYRRIIDMIYSTNDKLLDNDSLQYATKTGAKWKKIRKELIEVYNKIYIEDGYIRVKKCTEKLQKSLQNIEQKSFAGKASAEARNKNAKSLKKKKTTSTAVETSVDTAVGTSEQTSVPTNQEPNNQYKKINNKKADQRDDKSSPEYDPRWFDGEVIKLRRGDYNSWLERYGGTDEQFWDYLTDRDEWYQEQPPERRKTWFMATSKHLESMEGA